MNLLVHELNLICCKLRLVHNIGVMSENEKIIPAICIGDLHSTRYTTSGSQLK